MCIFYSWYNYYNLWLGHSLYIACFEKKIQFGNSINKNSQNLVIDIAILCVFICAISEKEIAQI